MQGTDGMHGQNETAKLCSFFTQVPYVLFINCMTLVLLQAHHEVKKETERVAWVPQQSAEASHFPF